MSGQYLITSRFEDGVEMKFTCGEEENILAAALRQEVRLLCQCKKAFCGSCKAVCTEGDYEFGSRINVQVLPPDEEEDGVVVTCDTFPRSNLMLEFPYTSDRMGSCTPVESQAKLMCVERLSTTVYRLVLRAMAPDGTPAGGFSFKPGQYMEIGIPDSTESRAFSIANVENDEGDLEFLIRLVPNGLFAEYLENCAAPGQVVKVNGPFGEFTLERGDGIRLVGDDFQLHDGGGMPVFIGGSTGLAPLVSMLRELKRRKYNGECHLFFGMHDAASMFYEKELRDLKADMPGLALHLALIEPPTAWDGYKGSAVAAFKEYFSNGTEKLGDVYLCGPAPMIDATLQVCNELGIPGGRVHREAFVASGSGQA